MLRIGILMPRSTLFPSLGLDFLAGMKENLKQQELLDKTKLITENIGFGINEQEIYAIAEKMLLQEDVDLVVLFADIRITEMLQPLFTASNKLLLVVNFGANFPETWQPASTTIVHSLNFCLHAELTGKLAALETNQKAISTMSYYDAGYLQCFSMLNGHQQQGGIPSYHHITHLRLTEFTIEPLVSFLESNQDVNTLLCLFSGDQAQRFYQEISLVQKKFKLHLYAAPMMFDVSLKEELGMDFTIDMVKGYVPWHPSLINEYNNSFQQTYISDTGKAANYFSLLGWETGLIVSETISQRISGNTNASSIVKSLTTKLFDSPRGWMKIDAATHHSYGPSYLATLSKNFNITIDNEIEGIEKKWEEFTQQKLTNGESSGWRNTYLCI